MLVCSVCCVGGVGDICKKPITYLPCELYFNELLVACKNVLFTQEEHEQLQQELLAASISEDAKIIALIPKLVQRGADVNELTKFRGHEVTALHLACAKRLTANAEALIRCGASVSAWDLAGFQPFLYAIISSVATVGEFHHHVRETMQCINTLDIGKRSPLSIIALLLRHNVDISNVDQQLKSYFADIASFRDEIGPILLETTLKWDIASALFQLGNAEISSEFCLSLFERMEASIDWTLYSEG